MFSHGWTDTGKCKLEVWTEKKIRAQRQKLNISFFRKENNGKKSEAIYIEIL